MGRERNCNGRNRSGYGCEVPQVDDNHVDILKVSNEFSNVGECPQELARIDVTDDNFDKGMMSVVMSYVAVPESGSLDDIPDDSWPIAKMIVTYDDGCGETEIRQFEEAAVDYCLPQMMTFTIGLDTGSGIYRVYAYMEDGYMNNPQYKGNIEMMLHMMG